ncbi:MAG: 2,3-bisphosphoglycerate-independent phosphoglycerate mutase [Proteobacteria bacterium]|nr:2,3-bisphosphoglycerate-independent phosphoglycerate mutase [Pseudomonadota bacterium]
MRNVTVLIVLDGFGHSESSDHNAIAAAATPNWDALLASCPNTLISGSGSDVGLPDGQMGNSEVGHMTLGSGRVMYQDLTRVSKAIADGEFARNRTLNSGFGKLKKSGGALHIMGLMSPGGVHSHEDHILELIRIAADRGISTVYLHAFLDGRDTPPRSARATLAKAEALFAELGVGRVASICGRYFAMDRDQRWDRIERAYNLIVRGEAPFHAGSATQGLDAAYERDESDEFVQPTSVHPQNEIPVALKPQDMVVFMNFRADRARQLTRAMSQPDFAGFTRRSVVRVVDFVTLTRYADDIDLPCAFSPPVVTNTLGEYVAALGKNQLRIAETEKYAHVTFFFSGGREEPFDGEDRILVPSPDVATYDLKPEMSAEELTDKLVNAIESQSYDLIVCNYANGDMVGHTGVFEAAVQAVQTLDRCLGRVSEALKRINGQMLITADHGNVEQMSDIETGQAHTAHTCEPVPLLYYGPQSIKLLEDGALADVAPTLLHLMHLEPPSEMTGQSLVRIWEQQRA